MKVKNPNKIEVEMTFTMTIEAWKALKSQLNQAAGARHDWPANELVSDINETVEKVEQTFYPNA